MKKLTGPVLAVLVLVSCFGFMGPRHHEKQNIKVISFNIRNSSAWSTRHDGENCWMNRREAVARMISQEKPDAIGLQEMLGDQVRFLDSVLVGYQRVGVGRDDGDTSGEYMAVYFNKDRFRLERSATYWLSATPDHPSRGWDAACIRTVTMVLLKEKGSGRRWLYMNTHLDHVGPVARAESAKELRRLADEWGGKSLPVVVGGDMNSSLEDTIFNVLYAGNLLSARTLAAPCDTLPTYNAYGKEKASQIDHFFVRNLQPKSFRLLDGDYGVPYISDHYPIEMEF